MLTYPKVYDSIHNSITNVCRHLEVEPIDPIKKYFGMTVKRWTWNVLMQTNPPVFRLDNYGRSKEWIIMHEYAAGMHRLKDSGLPIEVLCHYSQWQPRAIMPAWNGADCLDRQDYIILKSLLGGFDRVYRTLFVKQPGNRQKFNEINRLCLVLLRKAHPTATIRHVKLLFSQYNHVVRRIGSQFYYEDLKYAI